MELFQGPKYQVIVNIHLGDGTTRRGQVLEVDGEKAAVQVIIFGTPYRFKICICAFHCVNLTLTINVSEFRLSLLARTSFLP